MLDVCVDFLKATCLCFTYTDTLWSGSAYGKYFAIRRRNCGTDLQLDGGWVWVEGGSDEISRLKNPAVFEKTLEFC